MSMMKSEANVPDYLKTESPEGIDTVGKYQTTPRIKVIQAMSNNDLIEQFGVGSAIIQPDSVLVAAFDEPWIAIPLVFFPTWAKWRDIDDRSGPMIAEQTSDPDSPLAKICKNPNTRYEDYPDGSGMSYRNLEALNFILLVIGGEADKIVAAMTFQRGSHAVGRRLCGYIKRRGVDIFANRIEFRTTKITNQSNQTWYSADFSTPDEPWISAEQAEELKEIHGGLAEAHRRGMLGITDDE